MATGILYTDYVSHGRWIARYHACQFGKKLVCI